MASDPDTNGEPPPGSDGRTITANSDFDTGLRMALAAQLGHSAFDDRDRYDVFGWETDPDKDEYLGLYLRNPYARAVIDRPAMATWRHAPTVSDGDAGSDDGDPDRSAFESAVDRLEANHDVLSYCDRVDRLAGPGEYALLFVDFNDVDDPDNLDTEYNPDSASLDSIRGFRVYPQAQVDEVEYGDFGSDRWGRPETYTVDLTDDIDDDADESRAFTIHHTRVVAVPSTQLLDDEDKSRPRLEPVLNALYDIEKTMGAVAEAAFASANSDLWLNFDPEKVDVQQNSDEIRDELLRWYHQQQPFIRTQGGEIEQLGGEVQDPSGIVDAELSAIAAQTGIPKRILTGDAAGELSASEEDTRRWYARIRERQQQYAEAHIYRPLIDMLRAYGILPEPSNGEYEVGWPSLFEPTEEEIASRQQTRSETVTNLVRAVPGIAGEAAIEYVETGDLPELEAGDGLAPMDEGDAAVRSQFARQFDLPGPLVDNATRYSEGDEVDTPDGVGVVVEIRTEDFEGPDGDVQASDDSPAYVVGTEDGAGVYRASDLEATTIETDVEDPEAQLTGNALTANQEGHFEWPESWTESETPARIIALKAWAGLGGRFTSCRREMAGEIASPARFCADMKDRILMWEGWRQGG